MIAGALKKFGLALSSRASVGEAADSADFAPSGEGEIDYFPVIARIRKALPALSEVARSPVTVLKGELELKRAETAPAVTPAGIRATMRDMRLWKRQGDNARPESVYAFVNIEEFAIYENRVVKALIDKVIRFLASLEDRERKKIRTLYGAHAESSALSRADLVRYIGDYALSEQVSGNAYSQVFELKRRILRLRGTEFYAALDAAAPFKDGAVKSTDIFNMNKRYRECFDLWYYLAGFERSVSGLDAEERENAYACYVSLALVRAYRRLGYRIEKDAPLGEIFKNFAFDGLILKDGRFEIAMGAAGGKISVCVSCPSANLRQSFRLGAYSEINATFDKEEQFAFTPHHAGYGDRIVFAEPCEESAAENVAAVAKLTAFTLRANKKIYEKVCPVCGGLHTRKKGSNTVCLDCGAAYLFLGGDTLWINGIRSYSRGR